MLTVFTFEDEGSGKTRFTMTWQPHNAPAEEQAVFAANHASAASGWAGSLDKLEAYLASIKQA